MAFARVLLGVVIAFAATIGLSLAETPAGWFLVESGPDEYSVGVTDGGPFGRSGFLRSLAPRRVFYGTLMQSFDATAFRGQRIRMSAQVKSVAIGYGCAGLWMRVDGGGRTLRIDDMADRSIRGTWDWTRYELVLDVPRESELIAFGLFLLGPGEVLIDNVNFEKVGLETPATGRGWHVPSNTAGCAGRPAPSNLDFEAE